MCKDNQEFLRSLHEEKFLKMRERERYIELKIGFIIGILGVGSLGLSSILSNQSTIEYNISAILVVTPLVAIGYDHYIYAADHNIRRIGAFIRKNPSYFSEAELKWEEFVPKNRAFYAPIATLLFDLITAFFAFFGLKISFPNLSNILLFLIGIILIMFIYHRILMNKFDESPFNRHQYNDY